MPVPSLKINVDDVEDMAIGLISVQLHQEEDVDNPEDDEEDMNADVVEVVQQDKYRLTQMLPYRCWMQVLLARQCNRVQVQL